MISTFLRLRSRYFSFFITPLIFVAHAASGASCSDLVKLNIPDVTITSSTKVFAGKFALPNSSNTLETPAFCRVVAVAKPTSDSIINFEVWIPEGQRWNHGFLGVGNGGYNGVIQYSGLAYGLERGFATASTDTGHTGADLSFAAGHPQKIIDWGYRAIHLMTQSAKLMIRDYARCLAETLLFHGLLNRRASGSFGGSALPRRLRRRGRR